MTALVYVGSLADDGGITIARCGPHGELTRVGHVPGEAPSFLAAHPTLPVLYAVHGTGEGTVAAYDIGPGGKPTARVVLPTHGVEPCHLAVAPDGSALAVANYADGVVSVRALDPSGRPSPEATLLRHEGGGPHPERQRGPHAHMCHYTADGLLHVVDLGADRVHRYLPDLSPYPAGPVPMPAGNGPRHVTTDGRGHWYVAGELDATVSGWAEADGGWHRVSFLAATGARGRTTATEQDASPAARPTGTVRGTDPDATGATDAGRTGAVGAGTGSDSADHADRVNGASGSGDSGDSGGVDGVDGARGTDGSDGTRSADGADHASGAGGGGDRPQGAAPTAEPAIEVAVRAAVEAAVAALGAPVPGPGPDGDEADVDYPSHIALSPDGRFVYVADRGPDTIGVFRADAGRLTPLAEVGAGGQWPRHFALAGEHLYVANQNSDEVTAFVLRDGVPERQGAALRVPSPSCVLPWDRPTL